MKQDIRISRVKLEITEIGLLRLLRPSALLEAVAELNPDVRRVRRQAEVRLVGGGGFGPSALVARPVSEAQDFPRRVGSQSSLLRPDRASRLPPAPEERGPTPGRRTTV